MDHCNWLHLKRIFYSTSEQCYRFPTLYFFSYIYQTLFLSVTFFHIPFHQQHLPNIFLQAGLHHVSPTWENKTLAAILLQDSKSGWEDTSFGAIDPDSPFNAILLEIWSGTSLGTMLGKDYRAGPQIMSHIEGFKIRKLYHCASQCQKLIGGKFHYEKWGIVFAGK